MTSPIATGSVPSGTRVRMFRGATIDSDKERQASGCASAPHPHARPERGRARGRAPEHPPSERGDLVESGGGVAHAAR